MPIVLKINGTRLVKVRSWASVHNDQPGANDDECWSTQSFPEADEGDVMVMHDRNSFAQEWPNRRVFVVLGAGCVHIFDEHGVAINEPSEGVADGRQALGGSDGFLADWKAGYYTPHISGPTVAVPRPMGEVRWRFDSSTWVGVSAP